MACVCRDVRFVQRGCVNHVRHPARTSADECPIDDVADAVRKPRRLDVHAQHALAAAAQSSYERLAEVAAAPRH